MKKYGLIICCCFAFSLTFGGCAGLKTLVDNAEKDYVAVPIVRKGSGYMIDDYRVVRRASASMGTGGFIGGASVTTTGYIYYKDRDQLRAASTLKTTAGARIGGVAVYSDSKLVLRIDGTDYDVREWGGSGVSHFGDEFNRGPEFRDRIEPELMFQVQDEKIGEIAISRYYRVQREPPEKEWVRGSGLTVSIDGSVIGIVSFNPRVFYVKNEREDWYRQNKESLIFYMLTAYFVAGQ